MNKNNILFSNSKFLIVDNFGSMRRIIRNILKEIGYSQIEEAENGLDALNKIQIINFDFIICDLNIAELNGISLLTSLKSKEETKHIPFLIVTAESKKENIIAAAQAGASGYVVKPFTSQTLADKINSIFEKKSRESK